MTYKVVQAQGTALTDLYTVPSGKNAVISTIAMCNYGTAATTDAVAEGTANLYFTDARARAAVLDPFFLMGA